MAGQGSDQLIDEAALERFINEHVPGGPAPITVQKHVAGFSNVTFFVSRGDEHWVLRRPPAGPLLPTAHDVLREYRFIAALQGKARVPKAIASCEDTSVIGAPFYLMERKDGMVSRAEIPPAYDNPAGRRKMGEEMIDALVELHAVDWQAAGLTGRSEGFLPRQLKRWSSQWELTRPRTRDLPGMDELTEWLGANMPEEGPSTIVHGDYKPDNVMFDLKEPKLIAIFDWEMATIGDPLADLGWLMSYWGDPHDPPPPPKWGIAGGPPLTTREGFPSIEEMVALYEQKSGRSMRHFVFYHVLAVYKLAVILEGLYMQFLEATAANPGSERFEWQVPTLVDRAHRIITKGTGSA
jgi:aminoglycoside phosphotransferase (APT) family kinase protein